MGRGRGGVQARAVGGEDGAAAVESNSGFLFRLRSWLGVILFIYFANIVFYQGMKGGKEGGWMDGRNSGNHIWSLDAFCAIV